MKISSIAGFEPATSSARTAVTPDTHIIQETNNSADLHSTSWAVSAKEKTPTTELSNFDRK